jgi:dipeptidase
MLVTLVVLVAVLRDSCGCTTLIAGSKATVDGSVLASHSADGGGTLDARLVYVPARDYATDSKRAVYASPENYPRYVGRERGIPAYFPEACEAGPGKCESFEAMGYIPQVNHTYAYYESTYGIQNEHQVGMGESTCSGVFVAKSLADGGRALLSIDELSRIALERATTAREAVQIMGDLSEQYGFYGAGSSFEGGAENLMVIDPTEGFIFHVLPDPTGESSIWVAARVPDDSVGVVANMFVVREVDLSDTQNFLGRQDMWEVAEASGLWRKGEVKDFTRTFSDGEYAYKYYSGRRVWGSMRLLAPNAVAERGLGPYYVNLKDAAPYPTFVSLVAHGDALLTPHDFFAVHRDFYAGTQFSTGEGNLAAGAFGNPWRYSGGSGEGEVDGNWERTIVLARTSSSLVVQARSWLPNDVGGIAWFGPHNPTGTVYTPIVPAMKGVPPSLADAWQGRYSDASAFWAHRNVGNVAQIKFNDMVVDVSAEQVRLEHSGADILDVDADADSTFVARQLFDHAAQIVQDAHALMFTLLFRYADGYTNQWTEGGNFVSTSEGYPAWFLGSVGVGWRAGPPDIDSHHLELAAVDVCVGGSLRSCLEQECVGTHSSGAEDCTQLCLKHCE